MFDDLQGKVVVVTGVRAAQPVEHLTVGRLQRVGLAGVDTRALTAQVLADGQNPGAVLDAGIEDGVINSARIGPRGRSRVVQPGRRSRLAAPRPCPPRVPGGASWAQLHRHVPLRL